MTACSFMGLPVGVDSSLPTEAQEEDPGPSLQPTLSTILSGAYFSSHAGPFTNEAFNMSESKELDRVGQLKQMRDELRLQAHLAKAEAKDEWVKAEAKWDQLKQELPRVDETADEIIDKLSDGAKKLAQDIRSAYKRIRDAE